MGDTIEHACVALDLDIAEANQQHELAELSRLETRLPISLDLKPAGVRGPTVKTLMADTDVMADVKSAQGVKLAPFAAWVAEVN